MALHTDKSRLYHFKEAWSSISSSDYNSPPQSDNYHNAHGQVERAAPRRRSNPLEISLTHNPLSVSAYLGAHACTSHVVSKMEIQLFGSTC